jgi:hypothetical protein
MADPIKVWGNFLVHEKLDPANMTPNDVVKIVQLCEVLAVKEPMPRIWKSYKERLLARRLVCSTAMDLAHDLSGIKHKSKGKPLMGRGLLDIWTVVYAERFGSNVGTNGWFETKRRNVKTKIGQDKAAERREARLEKDRSRTAFPIDTPAGPVEYGDMIQYEANGAKVAVYARSVFNGWIVDGNVMCDPKSVTKILSKNALQTL